MNDLRKTDLIQLGLSEGSVHYSSKNESYEIFSSAEDAPDLIYNYLISFLKDKVVLDLGCGTGKYCKQFSPHAKLIMGVDISGEQLQLARAKLIALKNVKLKQATAKNLPFENNVFDIVFASWFLGVIKNQKDQKIILNECFRVLKPGGKIILVENGEGGEFELIRGRVLDPLKRTHQYNQFLLDMGFRVNKQFQTYFSFKSTEEASEVIGNIWGREAREKVKKPEIEHNVLIFSKEKAQ